MRPHLVLIMAGLLASALLATFAPRSEAATVLLVAAILATAVGAIIALVNAGADRPPAKAAGEESRAVKATLGVLGIIVVALILNVGLTLLILWARGELTDWPTDPPAGLKPRLLQYLSVGVFAGAVGFSELVGRYRDDPYRLIGLTRPGSMSGSMSPPACWPSPWSSNSTCSARRRAGRCRPRLTPTSR